MKKHSPQVIPLKAAMLCVDCQMISDSRNDTCPFCTHKHCLLSLSRILNPSPDLGQITFILQQPIKVTTSLDKL